MARLGKTRAFAFVGRKVLTPIDRRLHGRRRNLSTTGTSFPVAYLTTTGRRSGQPRTTPLLIVEGPSGWLVAATNFGGPRPAWAMNLLAEPRAHLEWNGSTSSVRARLATDAEQAEAWPSFDAAWPAFEAYRDRIDDRTIDMFVLEPVT